MSRASSAVVDSLRSVAFALGVAGSWKERQRTAAVSSRALCGCVSDVVRVNGDAAQATTAVVVPSDYSGVVGVVVSVYCAATERHGASDAIDGQRRVVGVVVAVAVAVGVAVEESRWDAANRVYALPFLALPCCARGCGPSKCLS